MAASVDDPLYAARVKLEVERRLFGGDGVLRVGRFEVGERLGAGGMSVVYEARDRELDRRVALKLLQDGAHGERLMREARALAKLRHPNVLTVYEVGRWDDHVFLALERVEGETLGAWATGGRRSLADVLHVTEAVADGLAAVHALGLVHRDVKPDNVLVDASGAPRVVDFGLVSGAGEETRERPSAPMESAAAIAAPLTRPGATPGTPRYIAPEREAGAPASPASDQYSLGVVLDDLIAGREDVPDSVRAIAARARAEAPGDRFHDLAAMRDALARERTGRRRWGPILTAIAGALALVALVAYLAPVAVPETTGDAFDDPPGYAALSAGTDDVEARREVHAGLLAVRDGDRNGAAALFDRAAERDEAYGAATFWRSLLASSGDLNGARLLFGRAQRGRARMSPELRAIVAAYVPCIQTEPLDHAACRASLGAAAERMPTSPHLWHSLAGQLVAQDGASLDAVRAYRRAREADPGFLLAIYGEAQTLAYLGRFDDALALTDECLARAPGADACIHDRIWIHQARGECEAMADDARRLRAAMPENAAAYAYLASAAMGRGDAIDVIREHLRQSAERQTDPARRTFAAARDVVELAILSGDFDAASAALDTLEEGVRDETDRPTRLVTYRLRILLALETGQPEEAARIAGEALVAQEAWEPDPRDEDFGIARDATPFLLDVLRDTHAIDDAERGRRRDAWLASWHARAQPFYFPYLWLAAYARSAHDATEAAEAIAAMPEGGPPPFHPLAAAEAGVGRVYALAGRTADAIPLLRRAASSCYGIEFGDGVENAWELVRASHDLGTALEASGEREGACQAYGRVLARWGSARPRSVTADAARARHEALGCVASTAPPPEAPREVP